MKSQQMKYEEAVARSMAVNPPKALKSLAMKVVDLVGPNGTKETFAAKVRHVLGIKMSDSRAEIEAYVDDVVVLCLSNAEARKVAKKPAIEPEAVAKPAVPVVSKGDPPKVKKAKIAKAAALTSAPKGVA